MQAARHLAEGARPPAASSPGCGARGCVVPRARGRPRSRRPGSPPRPRAADPDGLPRRTGMSKICSADLRHASRSAARRRLSTPRCSAAVEPRAADSVSTIWQISSARAPAPRRRTWRAMTAACARPRSGPRSNLFRTIEVKAHPCFFLIFSASLTPVRRATATSFVKCSPPTCSTAVCHSEPFSKMASRWSPADGPPGHPQLLLVLGEAALGRGELVEDGLDHLDASALARVTVVLARRGAGDDMDVYLEARARHPGGIAGCRPGRRPRTPGQTCRISRSTGSRPPWPPR